jgi:hypothetical protein
MEVETFMSRVEMGKLVEFMARSYKTVRVALRELQRRRLISWISLQLTDDRDPRKDILTIRILRIRGSGQ